MAWVKLDDAFDEHEKIVGLTDGAFRLHVCAMTFSARRNLAGLVPFGAVAKLQPRGSKKAAAGLVAAGIWHLPGHSCETCDPVPEAHYAIHAYATYNPVSDAARLRRVEKARRAAQARWNGCSSDAPKHEPSIENGCLEMPPSPVSPTSNSSSVVKSVPASIDDDEIPSVADRQWATERGYGDDQLATETALWRARSNDEPKFLTSKAWRGWIGCVRPWTPDEPPTVFARCSCGAPLVDGFEICLWCDTPTGDFTIDLTELAS